jgi:hypothetical protein
MPDVRHVAGEAAGHDEHRIDPHIVSGTDKPRGKRLGSCRNPAEPELVQSQVRFGCACPRLHFDESDGAASSGNKINLADRRSHPPGEDPPSFESKPERRKRLGAAATLLREPALHLIASARS